MVASCSLTRVRRSARRTARAGDSGAVSRQAAGRGRMLTVPVAGVRARAARRHLGPAARQRRARAPRRSTSWRRAARRWSPPRRGRSRSCSSASGGGGITVYVRSPDRPLDLLLRASRRAMRRACSEGQRGRARRSDRLCRRHRQRRRRQPPPPFRASTHGARRALVAGRGRSIPIPLLPGSRAAGPLKAPRHALSSLSEHRP